MRQPIKGFTLVELMTVILVLGILFGVGVPTYRNYLMRAQRAEAKTTLMRVQAQQEKFYMQNNSYTTDVSNPPPAGAAEAAAGAPRGGAVCVEEAGSAAAPYSST